jgi:hypothetical protein
MVNFKGVLTDAIFCSHKLDCGGTYVVTKLPETPGQQMVPEGKCLN